MTASILLVLLTLTFLILKPILMSIVLGVILAIILLPLYKYLTKKYNRPNIFALIICLILVLIIILPIWFLTPIALDQSFKVYQASQQMDFVTPLKSVFPSLFASDEFSKEVGSIIFSFVTRMANSLMNSISGIILNFPTLVLQWLVILFTLFFILRDKEKIIDYIKSISPFSRDIEKKFFESSKAITISVLYGQVVVGILQGLLVGIGFLLFRVPNNLLLTLFACAAGVFPILGTTIIWFPVMIYLFLTGNVLAATGIFVFGAFSTVMDNFLRPIIVSKRAMMHPALIMIGMIGGLFFFGIIGFILGPLILAYLLIVLELYRKKDSFKMIS